MKRQREAERLRAREVLRITGELERLSQLEGDYRDAWERSKVDRLRRQQSKDGVGELAAVKSSVTSSSTPGDPRFLAGIRSCVEQRADLGDLLRKAEAAAPVCATCGGSGVKPWHRSTRTWWTRIWASPMGPEFLAADVDALHVAAALVDRFWWEGGASTKLAAEIRQQLARFGATPLDRRRLEWELEKPEPEAVQADPGPVVDPRKTMRLVG